MENTSLLKAFFAFLVLVFLVLFISNSLLLAIGDGKTVLNNWAIGFGATGLVVTIIFLGIVIAVYYSSVYLKTSLEHGDMLNTIKKHVNNVSRNVANLNNQPEEETGNEAAEEDAYQPDEDQRTATSTRHTSNSNGAQGSSHEEPENTDATTNFDQIIGATD